MGSIGTAQYKRGTPSIRIETVAVGNSPPGDVNVNVEVPIGDTPPIWPGAMIDIRPAGILNMIGESGGDEKTIAVPSPKLTRRPVNVGNQAGLPGITAELIQHLLEHHKDLEPGKRMKIAAWGDWKAAKQRLPEAIGSAVRSLSRA